LVECARSCRSSKFEKLGADFRFSAVGKDKEALAHSRGSLWEICGAALRLWAASDVDLVNLDKRSCYDVVLINAVMLADLLEQCQCLKPLALKGLRIDVNLCRVLDSYSRPGLEIELRGCELTDAGTSALVEVLGRSQGPTKLAYCYIDNVVLADGLKSLSPFVSYNLEVYEREVLVTTGALRENKGLVELELHSRSLRVIEIWGAICHSLETYPTLEILRMLRWPQQSSRPGYRHF
jgi:hypothetical protein